MQNLLGDTALSAAFTPAYTELLEAGQPAAARALALRTFRSLAVALSLLVAAGIALAPLLVQLLVPGFDAGRQGLTVRLTQIMFPATGLLVLSAVGLAILQSHGRLFSAFAAPMLWNGAIVAALLWAGLQSPEPALAAHAAAWGGVLGAILQLLLQTGRASELLRGLPVDNVVEPALQRAWRRFLSAAPTVLLSRGVVQLGSIADTVLASLLPVGALAALGYAQTLYLLPLALFGTSISAASLPLLSRNSDTGEASERFHAMLALGARRIVFLGLPTTVGGMLLAGSVVNLAYGGSQFDRHAVETVGWVLACGMPLVVPSMLARLYATGCFAADRARIALRAAGLRLAASTLLAIPLVLVRHHLGLPETAALAGLILIASTCGAWIECLYLRRSLEQHSGRRLSLLPHALPCLLASSLGVVAARLASSGALEEVSGVAGDAAVLATYCSVTAGMLWLAGHPDARRLAGGRKQSPRR